MKRTIHPWVGDKYAAEGLHGKRILIMGESSYKPGGYPADYDISQTTVNLCHDAIGHTEGKKYWNCSRFYTRAARIFGFEARKIESRRIFWSSVAYYNFLQVSLEAPRVQPPSKLWEEARLPLIETIEELCPDYVISFSQRMWRHLPKDHEVDIRNISGIFAKKGSFVHSNQKTTQFLGFKHPTSFGFRWQDVKVIIDEEIV